MPATPTQILKKMTKIAPDIAITIDWVELQTFRWVGDGPDPAEDGYVAYDVDVWARAVSEGKLVEGRGSIGGYYDKPDDHDLELHGYLLDLLRQALDDLFEKTESPDLDRQIDEAKNVIERAARIRYEDTHTRKQDWSPRRRKPRKL